MIKVLIADDQELIRDSLKILLEDREISVVATVADGRDALEKIETKNLMSFCLTYGCQAWTVLNVLNV